MRCTQRTSCANLNRWAKHTRVDHLQLYNGSDNAVPGNGCGNAALPLNSSRFYSQFWAWNQCLQRIEAVELERGQPFGVIVHARPDMCFPLFPAGAARRGILEKVLNETRGAIAVPKLKPNPLACSDSFGVVQRAYARVYLSAMEQYFKCAPRTKWQPLFGKSYKTLFDYGQIPGELVLGKHLAEHNIRWQRSPTLAKF